MREVARFCQRCHATLRFSCPSCGNEQRHGGGCEKCGTDFLKYITAVVATKQVEADVLQDRFERRSNLLKNIVWVPIAGCISLLRHFITGSRDL